MGMPVIESSNVERSQAITDLIQSVALQQAALSHILNAEGEKLQLFISLAGETTPTVTPETLIQVNNSVTEMVSSISNVEAHLQAKLALFANNASLSFYFMKRIIDTNAPLEGAVFELIQDSTTITTATSDKNGIVIFRDILPGVYFLHEASAPSPYVPSPTVYTVIASSNLNTTINGTPAEDFTIFNGQAAST